MNFIKKIFQSILRWFKDLFSIEEGNVSAIIIIFVITWIVVLIAEYKFNHPLSSTLAHCIDILTGGAIGVGGANVTGNAVNTFQKIKSDISSGNIGNLINDLTNTANTINTQTTIPAVTTENTTSSTVTSGSINTNV